MNASKLTAGNQKFTINDNIAVKLVTRLSPDTTCGEGINSPDFPIHSARLDLVTQLVVKHLRIAVDMKTQRNYCISHPLWLGQGQGLRELHKNTGEPLMPSTDLAVAVEIGHYRLLEKRGCGAKHVSVLHSKQKLHQLEGAGNNRETDCVPEGHRCWR